MSRHPWLTFVLVGLAPPLLLPGSVVGMLATLFPAIAALLVISSDDQPQPLPEHRVKRLLVAVGVVVVLAGTRLAWTGLDSLPYKMLVIGVPVVLAAWVLSGVYAPSPEVRHWVRSLVATGAPRRVLLVAVLAWPLVAAASIAICAILPGLSAAPLRAASAGLLGTVIVTGVFTAALGALAWYGFVARRLLTHINPLAIGLLIGAVQWLVLWAPMARPATVVSPFFLLRLAGLAAAGVVGVWVYERSRGTLLPVWILGVLLIVSRDLAFLTVTPDTVAQTDTLPGVFAASQVAVALALVVAGRMWRRPEAARPAAGASAHLQGRDTAVS